MKYKIIALILGLSLIAFPVFGNPAYNTYSLDLELSSSQYAYAADSVELSITGDITIESWIKLEQLPSSASATFYVYSKTGAADADKSYMAYLAAASDKLEAYWYSQNATNISSILTDDDVFDSNDVGVWVHIAVVGDVSASDGIVYKNGIEAPSTPSGNSLTTGDSSSSLHIGAQVGGGESTDGIFDEFRVWDDIRTQQEIQDNDETHLDGNEDNLAAVWMFNGADDTDAQYDTGETTDAGGGGDNGTADDLTFAASPVHSTDVPFGEEPPAAAAAVFRRRYIGGGLEGE